MKQSFTQLPKTHILSIHVLSTIESKNKVGIVLGATVYQSTFEMPTSCYSTYTKYTIEDENLKFYPYQVTPHFKGHLNTKQMVHLNVCVVMSPTSRAAYNLFGYKRRKMTAKGFVFKLPKKNIETLWF